MLPVSHSAADAIEFLMVFHIMRTGEFVVWFGVLFGSFPNMYQAAAVFREDQVDGIGIIDKDHVAVMV